MYVADTMVDVRMLEGFARHFDLTLLLPSALGDRATNFWPPRPPARVERVMLRGGRLRFVVSAAWWLARRRRRFLVAFALDNAGAALAANLGRKLGGPPVILQIGRPTLLYVRCRRRAEGGLGNAFRLAIARVLVAVNERWADGVGAISGHVRAETRDRNPDTRMIPWYGVDTAFFDTRLRPDDAKARLGFSTDIPVVLYRSRIAPEKDPETFLRAVALLRNEGRTFVAAYMGGEHATFEEFATGLGVEVVARAPSGMDEIPVWYAAADVVVQTSHAEGLGISPLEALACGTPVVVSDTGGLREVVDGGRCGLLVPQGDARATADAIVRLLDDPGMGARLAAAGRQWVEQRFETEATFAMWARFGLDVGGMPQRPRILFVDHEARLSGGQRDLVDLVRGLRAERFELHAAVPEEGSLADALRSHGAVVHVVPMGGRLRRFSRWDLARRPWTAAVHVGATMAAAIRLAHLVRRLRPDVVHPNSLKAHLIATPAARLAGAYNVWHVRDILDGWLGRAWRIVAALSADRIVCLSEVAAEPFRSGRTAAKVRVVYNGVRVGAPDPQAVEDWRRRLGGGRAPLVGIVGQLAWWKGQDVFVEAAALVSKQRPDARFAVVGSCLFPENEAAFVDRVRTRSVELGLSDRLTWVGYVDPIEPLVACLDVFVHASRLPEPFGRVIVEAMALGTPVVASRSGAGPELVGGSAGVLVPGGDAEAMAAAIGDLVDDPELRARLADEGRLVAARFDIDRTASGVAEVWVELLR